MTDEPKMPAGRRRGELLPHSLPPIGINREQAAALIGVSTSLFDGAVHAGTMPAPRLLGGRNIWDVEELYAAFKKLPHRGGEDFDAPYQDDSINPWDDV